jgi:hypothetical protein
MIAIQFDKKRAEELIAAIRDGTPLQPGPFGWSGHDMLGAAGSLLAAAYSHGPALQGDQKVQPMHSKHRGFIEEQLSRDLLAAIEYYGQLTSAVFHGDFDKQFEPRVDAIVTETDTREKKVYRLKGFKNLR